MIRKYETSTSTAAQANRVTTPVIATMMIGLLACSTGCHMVSSANHAIPAHRLDPSLFDCPREDLSPIPFAALGQQPPDEHVIGGDDTLSIYVYGVFPPDQDATPVQQRAQAINQRYYPPHGAVVGPSTGLPVRVHTDGTIDLPLIGRLNIAGLTIPQAVDKITEVYREEEVLKEGSERVTVGLLTPRVKRVVVLREDTPATNVSLVFPETNDEIHRGSGEVIDLPVYENDVLHALAATGGLPGTDAAREIYVIRREASMSPQAFNVKELNKACAQGCQSANPHVIRIPLAARACDPLTFTPADIVLNQGDVLFVPRRNEYFVTGGLLPGARIALPRDEDIDVIEAIAMSSGSPGGPLGLSGAVLANGNPGYIKEATRVMILRTLCDGRQLPIRVDLDRAMKDPKERIRILPDDVVMVYQKPSGSFLNVTMNWIGGQWIPNAFLVNAAD
ncbi:polysaccharide biosynthesis/export family protein [Stieleria varia]|uniref:Polysaccharide biosynthesis/export protein n=1 Tax=Stieleria varia TaxID=2528005 RepID=A0A5C6B8D0_9BACT|nr:polysaccharide biosynthesis/export family protein [Stieleria varia]TWU07549.1 Polysaccharide biosynthesis/export protein [Stieleria varia]